MAHDEGEELDSAQCALLQLGVHCGKQWGVHCGSCNSAMRQSLWLWLACC